LPARRDRVDFVSRMAPNACSPATLGNIAGAPSDAEITGLADAAKVVRRIALRAASDRCTAIGDEPGSPRRRIDAAKFHLKVIAGAGKQAHPAALVPTARARPGWPRRARRSSFSVLLLSPA